jgi:spore coat protein H
VSPHRNIRLFGQLFALGTLVSLFLAASEVEGSELFDPATPLHRIEIQLDENPLGALRTAPRTDVVARAQIDGHPVVELSLHLKGATGSFRPIDDRPSFTLSTSKRSGSERILGTTKLHLNNGVEDSSRWREILGREMLSALGIPTTSATHARVLLNGRDLGLYVLIEGFTPDWIERSFAGKGGALFEPVAKTNDPPDFRRVTSYGQKSASRLPRPFLAAPSLPVTNRWNSTAVCINESSLIGFIAAEVLLAHADGYSLAHNNYRIWVPSDGSGLQWIPHGLDRLFSAPELPWPPAMAGPMAEAVMARPDGAKLVFEKIQAFRGRLSAPSAVKAHLDERMERLRPHLSRNEWQEIRVGADQLMDEWSRRWEVLDLQKQSAEPVSVLRGSETILSGWRPDPTPINAELSEVKTPEGESQLRIRAQEATLAGWTWTGTLPPGRYRLAAWVRLDHFEPLPFGEPGGVFVQKIGQASKEWLHSESPKGQPLRLEFNVESASTTTRLRIAFRGRRGIVDLDTKALRIHRIG